MTHFMSPKVPVTFVVGLTEIMTRKGQRVIRGRRYQRYDPKGQDNPCSLICIVHDLIMSQSQYRSP